MATQTGVIKSKETSIPIPVQKEHNHLKERANSAIAGRAYAFYLAEGGQDGGDMAHWLRAESEVLTRVPEIRESSSWYIVNVPIEGFEPNQIQVGVDENGAIITADKTETVDRRGTEESGRARESLFMVATWPSSIDPSTASAYVKAGGLTLTVKRANSAAIRD
jgi:HSP20 family molecular chaperone IbpA